MVWEAADRYKGKSLGARQKVRKSKRGSVATAPKG